MSKLHGTPGTVPQIVVLDTGGQYCHLITRKIRELGVYCEIRPSETAPAELAGVRGIVISGGPASVYEAGSPQVDPGIFSMGAAVLGICYGQQLLAWHLGGTVGKGDRGEYGLAWLELLHTAPIFKDVAPRFSIWMSHRDTVTAPPPGFTVLGRTATCSIAAMADPARRLYGVQFHPEVVHTEHGREILSNFLFDVAHCERDWNPRAQAGRIEEEIRQVAGSRNIFFFVSGGVDSTVAFTLCLRALGPARVRALYVDTGLMREGETEFVQRVFESHGQGVFTAEHAQSGFVGALSGVTDPERKRHIIGESFVAVQQSILESGHYLDQNWILGQGTIYPDTIESGGSAKADLIKTHHNRVAGIQKLIAEGRIVEPLHLLYKDEVRELGRELGLPEELLNRHPFPGPGLAIRCLCSDSAAPVERLPEGWLAPVRSVGVQGDERSYRAVLIIEDGLADPAAHERAGHLVNNDQRINRVVALAASHSPVAGWATRPAWIDAPRLDRLRRADSIVRTLCQEPLNPHGEGAAPEAPSGVGPASAGAGSSDPANQIRIRAEVHANATGSGDTRRQPFEAHVWQFPVVLVPLGTADRPDSVVLRPIHSVDGMTARAVNIPPDLLARMCRDLLALDGVNAVLLDLTHKPPGTIEWE